MTWKKSFVKVITGMLLLGALALAGGADVWDTTLFSGVTTSSHGHSK